VVWDVTVTTEQFVDIITDEGCEAVGLPTAYPEGYRGPAGWPTCREIGQRAWDDGERGIACRSAAPTLNTPGEELAWFDRGLGGIEASETFREFESWYPAGIGQPAEVDL
jgi:hypothetical protein